MIANNMVVGKRLQSQQECSFLEKCPEGGQGLAPTLPGSGLTLLLLLQGSPARVWRGPVSHCSSPELKPGNGKCVAMVPVAAGATVAFLPCHSLPPAHPL